ncbi:hook-length control protein FliK [Geodermatophilus siccatus]|uniref:Hook-length control protein FliK n=1 Tax=Geodermatophilus siccatus TaxID=1137991 RepID=A0A1G9ZPG0_9ACTN|nr:flagellar hook-length control protein FliK [Geodermatophilus siccatus]SDN23208.1 hook-length control protein FliK [Geodermatophilus siccatus]
MTTPLVMAAPAPAPAAPSSPTDPTAATDAPGRAERFASALDDAVSRGQDGPRGRERAAETDGTPAEPAPEAPDGEQPAPEQPGAGQPAVSGSGMPPGLWALLTGIGPGASGLANAADHAAAGSAVVPVTDAVAAGTVVPPPVVPGGVPDGVPAVVPPADVPAPTPTGLPAGAVPAPDAPAADAVLPATPRPTPATAPADPLPGVPVVLAAADAPGIPTAPELVAPDSVVPLPQPAAAPAPAEGAGTDADATPDQDAPAPAPAPTAAPTAPVPAPAVPAATPVATAEPAAPAAAPVAGQVAQHVAVLRSAPDGTHTMTLVLTPETLGPVEVQVTLSQGSVDLALKSATEAGRVALLDALPDLRRDLASAGLTCTNASVDRDAGASWASAQQHAAGDRAGQQGQPDGRGRSWLRGAEADPGRPAPGTTAIPSSGLDVRV